MPTYEDVLNLAQQLDAAEQDRLAEALIFIRQAVRTENNLELSKKAVILNRLKARLQAIPPGVSLVDELILERREAAKQESQS